MLIKFYLSDLPITKKGILKSLFVGVILALFSPKGKPKQGIKNKCFIWEVIPASITGK